MSSTEKPPYRIPSMKEIAAMPLNGLQAVSTFSGCGGSCLGLRMAGFRVLWANEVEAHAAETYRANHPGTILDTRSVREVDAAGILSATGMVAGELDLLEGSPPCQSFSLAGRRERTWGQTVKAHGGQRADDLFLEFARLLGGLRPKAFMGENVKGLAVGVAKGWLKEIMAALRGCGYTVKAKVLDAKWLGVPQSRNRLFIVGFRDDLGIEPVFPRPLPFFHSIRDACPWIGGAEEDTGGAFGKEFLSADGISPCVMASDDGHFFVSVEGTAIGRRAAALKPGEQDGRYFNLVKANPDRPSPCVAMAWGNRSTAGVVHPGGRRKFSILELKRICGFPDDFVLAGSYAKQWARLGNSVPPPMAAAAGRAIAGALLGG